MKNDGEFIMFTLKCIFNKWAYAQEMSNNNLETDYFM